MANVPKFTSQDRKDFASYEQVIDQWLDKSVDAGKALLAIKERKLYLIGKQSTFDAFVRARYSKTRQWAYDEINRAVVLAQTGYDLPTSVAQPLKGLDAKTQKDVVSQASQIAKSQKRETPTRKDVEAAIATVPAAVKNGRPALKVVQEATVPTAQRAPVELVVVATQADVEKLSNALAIKYTKSGGSFLFNARRTNFKTTLERIGKWMMEKGSRSIDIHLRK